MVFILPLVFLCELIDSYKTDEKDVDYKSQVLGVMHACGHDIHTSALLGVANVLSRVRDDIPGTIVFVHQFAEEATPGGAKPMIEGWLP
ncbi:M20/M25/M40 family metallo-hydrolase [Lentibacillus salinarum]|uniref:M20/M25/M40 family metallo-hydrolase n=1 Tax=Lentibacillus salinarum TaxID=446820 RepID=A0ABW3ZUK5_9BACI